jgi:DNA-binding PadR family transcriptional regulator
MKYTINIDQVKSLEWSLTLSEAALFSFVYALPSWAEQMHIGGQTWYFGSRNKAVQEVPIITDKPDTIYRLYKSLQAKGLIEWQKFGEKDVIRLTDKAKEWNTVTDQAASHKTDEKTTLGKKSELPRKKIRATSENFPTYKNTIDNNTNDKEYSFSNEKEATKEKTPNLVYRLYETYATFFESRAAAQAFPRTGAGHLVLDAKDARALKDFVKYFGEVHPGSAEEAWGDFLEAAWQAGDKWIRDNFCPHILWGQKNRLFTRAAKAQGGLGYTAEDVLKTMEKLNEQ